MNAQLAKMTNEPFMMHKPSLQTLASSLAAQAKNLEAASNAMQSVDLGSASIITTSGSVATIQIAGTLMPSVPSWMKFWGFEGTGYDDIENAIALALGDRRVSEIVLSINSPGGSVAGVHNCALAIRDAAKEKKVTSRVESLCASAAYYLASQSSSISAGINAEIGSIGTYMVCYDYSKMFDEAGVKAHVVSSGEIKGAGAYGSQLTDVQLANIQYRVDSLTENFISAIVNGRKMKESKVKALATGAVWIAKDALSEGLIDNVTEKFELKESKMNDNNQHQQSDQTDVDIEAIAKDAAAAAVTADRKNLADMKAAFPDDADFAIAQHEQGNSPEQAKAAYADVLAEKLVASEEARVDLQSKLDEATDTATDSAQGAESGVAFNASSENQDSSFMSLVKAHQKENDCSKTEAIKAVRDENPSLYQQFCTGK